MSSVNVRLPHILARLRTAVSLSLIVASIVVSVLAIREINTRSPATPPGTEITNVSAVRVGYRPFGLSQLGLRPFLLVVVVQSSDCPRCDRNLGAYRRLIAACGGRTTSRVVAWSVDPLEAIDRWLNTTRLKFDDVYTFPRFNSLDIGSVPTAMGVDHDGTVVGLWPGLLEAGAENQVLEACRKVEQVRPHKEGDR